MAWRDVAKNDDGVVSESAYTTRSQPTWLHMALIIVAPYRAPMAPNAMALFEGSIFVNHFSKSIYKILF